VNDNSEVGFSGSDDVDLDVDGNEVADALAYDALGANAIEDDAGNAETSPEHIYASVDWGSPGKQHATVNDSTD